MESQSCLGHLVSEGMCLLVPSPQSEAVTHDMEELSLQPNQGLLPLNERKNVLQLRLQQRRTREQLVDQGIMPPLKSPAAFHGQIRSLERARTENFLKHKIRSRPERAELVRMHILQETGAEPSLQATQMKLKRARLADNLNEKIAQRPGPMELVEKNIIPVDSNLKQVIIGQVNYHKVLDEDSSDALSPEQPASQESQSSMPSPVEGKGPEPPSPAALPPSILKSPPAAIQSTADRIKLIATSEQPTSRPAISPVQPVTPVTPSKPGPTLVKQSQQKLPSEKSRSKKGKEAKPRVKKLKYHQYVPPDQKQETCESQMDSSYARLLQQQQLFLQLQILSQQQQHYNYQTILPAPLKPVTEGQSGSPNGLPTSIVVSLPAAPPPPPVPLARQNNSLLNRKPGVLPANLEEMKVAELKLELKLRGLPVSGTKTDLIERLKPFQDSPSSSALTTIPSPATTTLTAIPMEIITTATSPAVVHPPQQVASEIISSTPPVSPTPSDPFTFQQDVGMSDANCEPQMCPAGPGSTSLPPLPVPEKDRRLHEKERQIEELMRKLEQEQKLVEELKMQLEVEKRSQSSCTTDSPSVASNITAVSCPLSPVKPEKPAMSNCSPASFPNSILGTQTLTNPLQSVVKLEDVTVCSGKPIQLQPQTQLITHTQAQVTTSPQPVHQSQRSPKLKTQPQSQPTTPNLQQFFVSHPGGVSQVLGQPQTLLTTSGQPQTLLTATGQSGTQILLPVSLSNNTTTIQLPSTTVNLQPVLQATVSNPGLVQASIPQLQTTKMETSPNQQLANHNSLLQTLTMCSKTIDMENHTRPEINPQCFLRNSPDSRASPRASPNHISNGPLNKSSPASQPTLILQPASLLSQLPKTKEPPRYEDAVKQSRNMHVNSVSQATSQQMDDLFDILIQSGEMTPFIQHEPPVSLAKSHPVTANITTLPVNTALSRHPPQIQVAPPPTLSPIDPSLPNLSSLATDNQLEAFLERTLANTPSASDPRTRGLVEELQAQLMDQQPYSPMDTSELSFCDSSSPPSSLNMGLSDPALDNMEWLDLTMPPGPGGALTPLGMPTDFLDSHDLQLHWD
uniref:myocardin-related transcription factor B isoform X1 n=1 Tax=Doryrhamphus excisus TaxID=161450 RepID=UPI0025AE788B|nr:myocardin-related transcription factor B isoform X1 [Doryrhamphus excisus]XP_057917288.1 myocardin-related transcription factor B isoform X1 [Doryrhamphus excisus]